MATYDVIELAAKKIAQTIKENRLCFDFVNCPHRWTKNSDSVVASYLRTIDRCVFEASIALGINISEKERGYVISCACREATTMLEDQKWRVITPVIALIALPNADCETTIAFEVVDHAATFFLTLGEMGA